MWSNGAIGIKNKDGKYVSVKYWCKHFEEPSEDYGIDGGRISKLTLRQNERVRYCTSNGRSQTGTCNFDERI